MKVLVIVVCYTLEEKFFPFLESLKTYLIQPFNCDVAVIAGSTDEFKKYERILNIRHRFVSPKRQMSKLCDFVTQLTERYDWYVKTRTDVELLEPFDSNFFSTLSQRSINSRVRGYIGPERVRYGNSMGGRWAEKWNEEAEHYSAELQSHVCDDQIYFFHDNVIRMGAFRPIINPNEPHEHEWFTTAIWMYRNIPLKMIGINVLFHHRDGPIPSGHVNV
jgi:hypothetical protein